MSKTFASRDPYFMEKAKQRASIHVPWGYSGGFYGGLNILVDNKLYKGKIVSNLKASKLVENGKKNMFHA